LKPQQNNDYGQNPEETSFAKTLVETFQTHIILE